MDRTIELTIALLLAAMLVCDRAYVWELSSYSAHENSQYHDKSTHKQEKTESPFLALASDIEDFIDAHEKTLIVLSTLAIALFTGTLWRSTTGLQDLAATQEFDMKESLRIAEKSANAAILQANTAQNAFISTHRPWITARVNIVSPLYFGDGSWQIKIAYIVKNVGSGPATDTNVIATMIPSVLEQWTPEKIAALTEMPKSETVTELRRLAEQYTNMGKVKIGFGRTIFPNEELRGDAFHIHASGPFFEKAKGNPGYTGQFHLLFCATYGCTFDDSQHVTAKAFVLYKISAEFPNINLEGETIDLSELAFVPVPDTNTDYAT